MNREDAREYLKHIPHFDGDKFIDEIYDDIESRTCENCKHFSDDKCDINFYDEWSDHDMGFYDVSIPVSKDFGCNKFKRKIDDRIPNPSSK